MADEAIALIEARAGRDGYLNSYYQVAKPGERCSNLAWDHELYCAGHLFQAAVAHARGAATSGCWRRAALRRPPRASASARPASRARPGTRRSRRRSSSCTG